MQIMMTPGLCSNEYSSTGGTFCESCFASFLMHGCSPDLACITNVVDDGKEATTLVLQYGAYEQAVELTDANRELLAFGGWPGWVQFVEELPSAPVQHSERSSLIATLDDYKDQVLTRVRKSGNDADEASFLVALGNMYVAQGDLSKGIQQHQHAIRIHESHGDWVAAARVYWTIAKLDPGAVGDLKTAITYMERAIALADPADKDAFVRELAAMRQAG